MSAIGLDIGNESCVIAAAKRGGVDVLLNDESKRETPAVVSFGEKQRFFGSAGAAFATANTKSTVSQIKRLIGKVYKEVEEELKLLPFVTSEGPRGGILIELEYLKMKWMFSPVEILGMLFKHLKELTEKNLESSVVDCVTGIPAYFSDLQRRMYLDAAVIAGLKPLKLMHDGTAIALGYGMYKTDLSHSGPTNVMFVDIGQCDTQVTVAAFEQGRMRILSHSFDQNLGGRDFDEVLFNHFKAKFNEQYKIDVCSNARASTRLRASCEKVKKVLSANAEAPLSIECLIGETDVKGFITREEFEKLSSKLLQRVTVPCSIALKGSHLSIDEICTIELLGSGSRVPAITQILTSFFGKEPTRTLNASECVARGCALGCAMLSPTIQVRDYEVVDSFPYSIVIPSARGEVTVFKKGSPFPNQNPQMHTRKIPFYLQVAYRKDREFPAGISHIIGRFVMLEDNHSSLWNPLANSRTVNLPITEVDLSTPKDELYEAMKKEKMLAEQDMKVEEVKDQRNTLVSYVYETRSKLSSAYRRFASDSEKEVIIKSLQETEDWLYEDSDDEYEQDYTGKLKHLKELFEPVKTRYKEANAIENATKNLLACIAKYRSRADSLPADKKERLKDRCIEAERLLNGLSQKDRSPKTLLHTISHAMEVVERECKSIIRPKPSFQRQDEPMHSDQIEQPVDSQNAITKAMETLQTCIEKYRSRADSLPSGKKERVKNECKKAERWLNGIPQMSLSPHDLTNQINHSVHFFESNCKSIIRSEPSSRKHEEPVYSDQMDRHEEPDQIDQPVDPETSITQAMKTMQTCIEKYRSRADSLPSGKKERVKDECKKAERWLNGIPQMSLSPHDMTNQINHSVHFFESNCKSIIGSEPSSRKHEEPVYSDQMDRHEEPDQIDQPVDPETSITQAMKTLQTCIEYYRSRADSLPSGKKERVKNECKKAERWLNGIPQMSLSPHDLTNQINHSVHFFESNCNSIIGSEPSSRKHEEPVYSDQMDRHEEPDQIDQPVDPETSITQAMKTLQTCIEYYRLLAEPLQADKKEMVKDQCIKAEQWFNGIPQKDLSPHDLTDHIKHIVQFVENNCKSVIESKPSPRRHEEPVCLDQRDRSEEPDQIEQHVDYGNAITKATKTLRTCMEKYLSYAETLTADKKEKVKNECNEAAEFVNGLFQKNLSPHALIANINHVIHVFESICNNIIKPMPSIRGPEKSTGSDQVDQTVDAHHSDQAMMDIDRVD